ncbi:MAG: hypothetical protein CMF42_02235 [Legionellales bacterium]|nr:hypothetical protein [Legionellales bacterium]|tara:strand:+ start:1516 stop:2160 length:645 start_codon:yes stop_codon:yes gene_type:complete
MFKIDYGRQFLVRLKDGIFNHYADTYRLEQKDRYILMLETKIQDMQAQSQSIQQIKHLEKVFKNTKNWHIFHSKGCISNTLYFDLLNDQPLKEGALAIDDYGAIGTLQSDCHNGRCTIKLFSNPKTRLVISSKSASITGVMENYHGHLKMRYPNSIEEVYQDQAFYTSGYFDYQPAGYLVGYVDNIQYESHHPVINLSLPNRAACPMWIAVYGD